MRTFILIVTLGLLTCQHTPAQNLDFYDPDAFREIHLTFSQPNWWTLLLNNYSSQTEIPADMTVDGVTYPDVGVRFRGNTSYSQLPTSSQKRSFNIRTDAFVPGQDIDGYDNLNLNNGYHDPTFIREFLTYMIARRHGVAPGCNFVTVYLNNLYWGVYINVQQPNKDMMGQWFRTNTGNRYRGFPTSGGFQNGRTALTWLGNNLNSYLSAYQAKQGDGTDLRELCDVLNNTPNNQLQSTLPAIFSVDQFYRYAAYMNIVTQTDSYIGSGKDHFLYHDDVHGAFHMFPFDVNEAFAGNSNLNPWYNTSSTIKPAFSQTIQFPDWAARYIAHYRTILEETFSWAELGPIITQYHAMIAPAVMADIRKIYSTQAFFDNIHSTVSASIGGGGGGPATIPGLRPLIQDRNAWLSSFPDLSVPQADLDQLQHTPAEPTSFQSTTVTVQASSAAASVALYHRSLGPFQSTPMFDDGLHGDGAAGDGVWGVILPPNSPGVLVDYYAAATTGTGVMTFEPSSAEHNSAQYRVAWLTALSPVKINEFLAKNDTVIADPTGEYDDYVELYNSSSQAVSVGGMYLTDDLTNPTKWELPAGQAIPGFGTLLVWCDEDGSQGPLHANFKLSGEGEEIALFSSTGTMMLDRFTFGAQVDDIATGRFFDGAEPWVTFDQPTPDQRNEPTSCGVRNYSALDPTTHDMDLSVLGSVAFVGGAAPLSVMNGPASSVATLFVTLAPAATPLPGTNITALLDPTSYIALPVSLNGTGTGFLTIGVPNNPVLAGVRVYSQALAWDSSGGLHATNAVELTICP